MRRSKFSLSHNKNFTMNQGKLIPFGVVEMIPGDSFRGSSTALIRTTPLNSPVMHPVHVHIQHYFVPTRLVYEDFEPFITGGSDGEGDGAVFPTIDLSGAAVGSLADYLGIPPGLASGKGVVNACPVRAYQLIRNTYFRDQDLNPPVAISLASGVDTTTSTVLQDVCWQKDYFTTARPTPQKGPEVTLPLGLDAPVKVTSGTTIPINTSVGAARDGSNNAYLWNDPAHPLYTDLSTASAATVNQMRLAMALQRFEEDMSRFGSNYTDFTRQWGVRSSDARLQMPEFLGGGRQTIQFSEVLQTAPEADEGVGNMYGHGIAALRSNSYDYFAEEHGYVISLMFVRPVTMYVQGLNRIWNRRTKEDFFNPQLAHIGQQEVLNKEVYAAHSSPNDVFGYQDRYDEYRRQESSIAGEFRTTLDYWHMARIFTGDVTLNGSFVTANPTNRIYQSTDTNQLYVMARHNLKARRLVPGSASSFIR